MSTPSLTRAFLHGSTYATELLVVAGGPGAALVLLAGDLVARLRWVPLALVLLLVACGPKPMELSAQVTRGGAADVAARVEAERLWSQRLDEHQLRAAITAWKRAVATVDSDADSWLMLSRASYFLGDGFLDLSHAPDDEVARAFEDGAAYADRGLRALSPAYEARRQAGMAVDEAAADLGVEAVPYIYWWGLNAIRWADRRGFTAGLRVYKHVLHVMEQVQRLDPEYAHAGADRFLGAFYTDAPGVAGGDVDKGRAYLERAVALAPAYLETRVVLAERLAPKVHDVRLFEENLRLIHETPAAAVADSIPEQEIAKKKAARLAWRPRSVGHPCGTCGPDRRRFCQDGGRCVGSSSRSLSPSSLAASRLRRSSFRRAASR